MAMRARNARLGRLAMSTRNVELAARGTVPQIENDQLAAAPAYFVMIRGWLEEPIANHADHLRGKGDQEYHGKDEAKRLHADSPSLSARSRVTGEETHPAGAALVLAAPPRQGAGRNQTPFVGLRHWSSHLSRESCCRR